MILCLFPVDLMFALKPSCILCILYIYMISTLLLRWWCGKLSYWGKKTFQPSKEPIFYWNMEWLQEGVCFVCKSFDQQMPECHDMFWQVHLVVYGGFLKWWYPTTMGFPTKMVILGCFGGTTIYGNIHITNPWLGIQKMVADPTFRSRFLLRRP